MCSSARVLSKSTMYYVEECTGNLLHCCALQTKIFLATNMSLYKCDEVSQVLLNVYEMINDYYYD